MLNLRRAAKEDHARVVTGSEYYTTDIISESRDQSTSNRRGNSLLSSARRRIIALLSVILGADTWFRDTQFMAQRSRENERAEVNV